MANYSASIKLNAVTNLTGVGQKISKSFANINKSAGRANSAMANLRTQTAGLGRGLLVSTGIIAGAAAATFGLVKSIANLGDDLAKTAQKVGIGVIDLQRLRYSMELGGGTAKEMDTALKVFSRTMDEANSGMAEYKEQFDRLGVSVSDADGNLKSSQSVLLEVADRFAILEDGAEKTSIAQQLFGRSGLSMIPMLNKGSAAIKEQGDWLEKHTRLLTEDEARASEELNDRLLGMKKAFSKVTVPIAMKLIPAVTKLTNKMTAFLSDLERHLPVIKKWAKIIGIATGAALAFFGPIIIFNKARALWGILSALKAVITATWGFNAALLASPFTWIVAGVVALGAAVFLIIKHWRVLNDFFENNPFGKVLAFLSPIHQMVKAIAGIIEFVNKKSGKHDSRINLTEEQEMMIEQRRQEMRLDVNMKIDQDGRASVTGAKSNGDLNLGIQSPLMIPSY